MQETDTLARFKPYLLIFPLFAMFCSGELSEFETRQVQQALGDSLIYTTETWGVDMNIIESGNKSLTLRGSYALTYNADKKNETRISGPVTIHTFRLDGSAESTVTCDSAVYQPDDSIFQMFGTVRVLTAEGKRLSTEFLLYNNKKDEISTDLFVTVVTPTDSINAVGLIGNTDLTNYTLLDVTGETVID